MKLILEHKRVAVLLLLTMLTLCGCAKKHVVESADALLIPDEVVIYHGSQATVYYIKDSEPFQTIVQAISIDSIDEVYESAVEEGDPRVGMIDSELTVDYIYKSKRYIGERAFTVLRFCMDGMYENEVLVGSEKGFTSGTYGFSFDKERIMKVVNTDEEAEEIMENADIEKATRYAQHLKEQMEKLFVENKDENTTHVETVVRLSQKHIDHTIRVELDLDEFEDTTF